VFISGNCVIHQFVRVGTLALMQGGSAISLDLPPYTVANRGNAICGLNTVGLRRAGFAPAERLELKQLYRLLFREGHNLRAAVAEARSQFSSAPARMMLDFVAASKRGVCSTWRAERERRDLTFDESPRPGLIYFRSMSVRLLSRRICWGPLAAALLALAVCSAQAGAARWAGP